MSVAAAWADIDLQASGRQVGVIHIEHSVHRSAYGTIPVPVVTFANGEGPTVLLIAGAHGDEYEGQLALSTLIRELDIQKIRGRVIVLPAANLPAVKIGNRVSPLDDGNLNRAYGEPFSDTPTGQIASFIANELLAHADVLFDLHSGGSSLHHLPCSYADLGTRRDLAERALAAIDAMNAPMSWIQAGRPIGPVAGRAALERDVLYLSGEFGGGGRLDADNLRVTERCVYRLLDHLGVYPLPEEYHLAEAPTRYVTTAQDHYVYAPCDGVLAPAVALGDEVTAGQLAGHLHLPESPGIEPVTVHFRADGIVACMRAMGRTQAGDCLFQLLSERPREEVVAMVETL